MFIDRAKIFVKGGDGGNGCMAFRREKFVPRGGPSGGDGGRGGSVYLEATDQMNTLLSFRYNPEYKAERGGHGEGSNRSGRQGEDIIVKMPIGTLVFDAETGEKIADLVEVGQRILVATGGRGGRGNAQFATSVNRAPRHHEAGTTGQARYLQLELKLLADVGLVGFPNAGKSTLISRISAAKPKIADYPFTTLVPNLGVVEIGDYRHFVVADIPGLIEGAHQGAGLGLQFLRHIERTKLLLHVIDVSSGSGRDPVQDYQVIANELASYNATLADKPVMVAANKIDALDEPVRLTQLGQFCEQQGLALYPISAVTGEGIQSLISAVARKLESLGQEQPESFDRPLRQAGAS
ncbi:MAG: GTPase ObgE [Acidobacteriota bacterium]